ncbi:exopolygalacturonase clone GBGE184-like [Vicia villosa]|uniref:exopolygalacturonase clone GBGE184-like n=1 Tax=Vicia villosa TaxID=3911 RepID=UPI00273B4835|nr:exopolygalacturonase clone GBGE184-like [Vicia villosa]
MATVRTLFFLGIVFFFCSLIGASRSFEDRRSLLDGGPAVIDVKTFGALADDKTDNVVAFTAAWIEACKNSTTPATLLFPEGIFRTGQISFAGPCTSPSPITVEVIGTIKATEMSEYVSPDWITFFQVDNMVLKGSGVFDGQGALSWPLNDCKQNKGKCVSLPDSLKFDKVNNSVVSDITSLNSMGFHYHLHRCSNVTFTNLTITAPGDSPNTDGMHISSSNLISVTDSVIGTGDDCISIGHTTSNITITGITCGPGHGISVGSLGKRREEKTVDGVFVRNCSFTNTTNGARIKTWLGLEPAEAKNIIYENLIMNAVQNPIVIDQSYGKKARVASTSVWKISDVHFRNISGTSVSNIPVSLQCSTRNPCENIEVADVDLSYVGRPHNTTFVSDCANAKAIFGGKLNPPACTLV